MAAISKSQAGGPAAESKRDAENRDLIASQAATIDVLRAMSASPGDARPVFERIVDCARTFCAAETAAVVLLDDEMAGSNGTSGWYA